MDGNEKVKIVNLPKIFDPRGNLTVIEELKQIPFTIARAYWIYDVPGGEIRGSHAFKDQQEIIIALSGSFDIVINDGCQEHRFSLNRSYFGLYIPPMNWRTIENFSTNAVCLVLSSQEFYQDDYVRNFNDFLLLRKNYTFIPKVRLKNNDSIELSPKPSVYNATIIEFQRISSGARNGNLSVIEGIKNLPFDIKRAFVLFDIPAGEDRGAHAHRKCHQFLIAVSGAFEVMLDDGVNKKTVRLDRPYYGLHIPPGIWAAEQSFSGGAVCLVFASHGYDESDYIRDYDLFLNIIKQSN